MPYMVIYIPEPEDIKNIKASDDVGNSIFLGARHDEPVEVYIEAVLDTWPDEWPIKKLI